MVSFIIGLNVAIWLAVQTLCFISSSEGSLHINDETTPPPMHGRDTKLGSRRYRDDDNVWKEYTRKSPHRNLSNQLAHAAIATAEI